MKWRKDGRDLSRSLLCAPSDAKALSSMDYRLQLRLYHRPQASKAAAKMTPRSAEDGFGSGSRPRITLENVRERCTSHLPIRAPWLRKNGDRYSWVPGRTAGLTLGLLTNTSRCIIILFILLPSRSPRKLVI
ncbi:hypothetical protein B0H13DRAFT_2326469 [Mycena leptocephala]|nr:hypothetical protein B0H13DRAFT_2326469 [Mycena leptocephala]